TSFVASFAATASKRARATRFAWTRAHMPPPTIRASNSSTRRTFSSQFRAATARSRRPTRATSRAIRRTPVSLGTTARTENATSRKTNTQQEQQTATRTPLTPPTRPSVGGSRGTKSPLVEDVCVRRLCGVAGRSPQNYSARGMDPLGLAGEVLDDKYAVDSAVGEGGFA